MESVACLLPLLICSPVPGSLTAGVPDLDVLNAYREISKSFVREVTLPVDPRASTVVYGNRIIGYFETGQFVARGGKLTLSLLPPTYRSGIEFYARSRNGLRPLGTRRFSSPVPFAFRKLEGTVVNGAFSSNFFLLGNARATHAGGSNMPIHFYALTILNRLGEIVWLHLPRYAYAYGGAEIVAKPIKPGVFAVLVSRDHFEIVDYRGQVRLWFAPRSGDDKATMHHDFIYLSPHRILTFGNSFRFFRFPFSWPSVNLRSKPFPVGILSPPVLVRGDNIIDVNFKNDQDIGEYWDTLTDFSPLLSRATLNDGYDSNSIEFTHLNSIDYLPGQGYLISLCAKNRLVFLDENFSRQWTVGAADWDDYHLAPGEKPFLHQHHATFLPNGGILLFDNLGKAPETSRVLELHLDPKTKIATVVNEYTPTPPLVSNTRGSAFSLASANVLAFFANPRLLPGEVRPRPDSIVEFDGISRREVARMDIANDFDADNPDGYRAMPLQTLVNETYLGPSLSGARPVPVGGIRDRLAASRPPRE